MQKYRIFKYKTNSIGKVIKDTDGNYILQKISVLEAKREVIKNQKKNTPSPIIKLFNKLFRD
jgi:hypothetical protein